jgi:hypothetical protein
MGPSPLWELKISYVQNQKNSTAAYSRGASGRNGAWKDSTPLAFVLRL